LCTPLPRHFFIKLWRYRNALNCTLLWQERINTLLTVINEWHGEIKMNKDFNVIIERDAEGFYVASVPALAGCHTQARSLDELVERIREAIELCLEVQNDQAEPMEFVGVQKVSLVK
jgi:predicted RNase H-like HicB family nuclease